MGAKEENALTRFTGKLDRNTIFLGVQWYESEHLPRKRHFLRVWDIVKLPLTLETVSAPI